MALTVEDRLDILDLLARYAHATDAADAEARADTFTDDGVFDPTGPTLRGRAEILAARRPPNAADLRHWITNAVIDGAGDLARVTTYLMVVNSGATTGRPPAITLTGVYYDTVRKVNGRWRFAYRNFVRDDLRDESTVGHRL